MPIIVLENDPDFISAQYFGQVKRFLRMIVSSCIFILLIFITIFWKSEEIFENDCVLLHIHFAHEQGPRWPIGLSRNEISFQRKIKFVKFCNFQSLSPLVTTCGILLKILKFSKVSNFPFKPASHTGANTMVNLTIINIL